MLGAVLFVALTLIRRVYGDDAGCTSPAFLAVPLVPLDTSLSMRSLVVDSASVCIQLILKAPASWVSVALSSSPSMVTSPFTRAVVFDTSFAQPKVFAMQGYAPSQMVAAPTPSISLLSALSANDVVSLTFRRPLVFSYEGDVTIHVDNGNSNILNWAYASSPWPAIHSARGSATVKFTTKAEAPSTVVTTESALRLTPDTTVVTVASVISMIMLGLIATHFGNWRWVNHRGLLPPPRRRSMLTALLMPLVDLKVGEGIIVLIYLACLVLVSSSVHANFADAPSLRRWSLASGHLCLVHIMLLLLPVARGQHWEVFFGISHERILKFHRWLGRLSILFGVWHLLASTQNGASITAAGPFGSQQVSPVNGFGALVVFATLGLSAMLRRRFYALFYYYHRIASIVGLVLLLLHATAVRYALIFPLGIYLLSGLGRLRGLYLNKFHASIHVHGQNTVTFELPATETTRAWADRLHAGAFFYINIPSISAVAWHPFSAIVTPDGDSIGFCMKSFTKGRFVDAVWVRAHQTLQDNAFFVLDSHQSAPSMLVRVEGPYGRASVNVDKYDAAVLICGGSGITPMLSLINMERRRSDGPKLFLHWVVKDPNDLLCVDKLMFPLPSNVSAKFYAGPTPGGIRSKSGTTVSYGKGRPVIDEVLNNEKFAGKRVCVLACGPPSLVADVQYQAHRCGFDFHKEVFLF
ncbi:hypothetical protein SDRG_16465 [Saprolegnia diclina VS20]|uniref:FAD-binding FR-type domain-containing protein n=1 Tax=Saprolegnia diclina (strain VS20) TaxID=1156394 RepID=T0PXC2_SAPDV|nr:hypothetical protein SDRG_16465 [Saprolegnia diclina VS20]EQC25680.1 hypothetical protein SDRG_16465 [Saprolegnia diclina VS20]|eukprot:XP_008620899.1 hypothetical protein SDRG_16465 [Saprolegnia diclina VS20]